MSACICQQLAQRDRFDGVDDLHFHQEIIDGDPSLSQIPVEEPYANVGEVERWYRCSACDTRWRLVEPDPPFMGVWERIRPKQEPGEITEWTWLSFLFVYDSQTRTYPVRYQIVPPDGTPYKRCDEALDGLVAEDAKGATIEDLKRQYPEPQFAVSVMNASSWESVEKNFVGMHDHWDKFSVG